MMTKPRFKIDLTGFGSCPFGLYVERSEWCGKSWERIEIFRTPEEAREFHEKIKDLPEYL